MKTAMSLFVILAAIGAQPAFAADNGQSATMENLKKSLDALGATFANVVVATRFLTDLSQQDILNRVWNRYVGEHKPTTTTVQVVQLATDPRCLVEINAIAVID